MLRSSPDLREPVRRTEPKTQVGLKTQKMCVLHVLRLDQYLCKKVTFWGFEFELLMANHAGLLFVNEEKKVARDIFMLLPHIPVLFITTLQTSGHKMAAFTVAFSRHNNKILKVFKRTKN